MLYLKIMAYIMKLENKCSCEYCVDVLFMHLHNRSK